MVRGAVYRSDALHHVSPDGVAALRRLGVDLIIDLRSPDEIAQVGRGALAGGAIEYLNAPVIPTLTGEAQGVPPSDDMADRYLWYLDVGREAFVTAFGALADSDRTAVVFHCAAGKDRTGVLAAMILSVLGVDDEDIAADYELTGLALDSILDRLARDPIHGEAIANMAPERRVVSGEVMRRFLGRLGDVHGGAAAWLHDAGVAPGTLQQLRSRLLSSSPSP